jgi:hypothetical protein
MWTTTLKLEEFINTSKKHAEIVNITAQAPTDLMLAQISDAYTFAEIPTHFIFTVKDSDGVPRELSIVIPTEVWQKMGIPITELVKAANRFKIAPIVYTHFIRPDIVDGCELYGCLINPMLAPPEPLAKLLNELKVLPRVIDAKAFKIVDPAQLAAAGCNEAVRIFLELDIITEARLDQYDDSIFDRHDFLVPSIGYMSEEAHEHIINTAKEYLNNIK